MYRLFGYYYRPLAEYLTGKTSIRMEKVLTKAKKKMASGGWAAVEAESVQEGPANLPIFQKEQWI